MKNYESEEPIYSPETPVMGTIVAVFAIGAILPFVLMIAFHVIGKAGI